jgi:hypothetical protein
MRVWALAACVAAAIAAFPAQAHRSHHKAASHKPPASSWSYGRTFASSWDEYQAMLAAAHGGTRISWEKLPDWTGLWEHRGGFVFDTTQRGDMAPAPLTPEYRKLYEAKLASVKKGIQWDPLSACLPAGYPRWLLEPFLREFILRPEEAWLLTEQEAEIRRIYTDNRGHVPEDEAYPLWEGDSIGFWDGDTLVIHTNHLKAGQYQRLQPDFSDQISTVERMRKIGPDQIEDIVDVYDPASLTRAWHVRHLYGRVKTPNLRINHWSCEENNNTVKTDNGSTAIVLPGEKGYRDPNNLAAPSPAPPQSGTP